MLKVITDYFKNIVFGYPWFLYLLILIPLLLAYKVIKGRKEQASVSMSTLKGFKSASSWKSSMRHLPFALRLLCLTCLIVALARPQTPNDEQQTSGEGIDIILCIDVSGSMTAQDFTPNRLEAAKKVASDFIDQRLTDRIGIVIFSGESFTQCPLTTDHGILKLQIEQIRNGLLEDGTAIGSGLATSVDRLRTSKAKSKVIILLTDGVNNGGLIDPSTAKEIAKAFKIKVYTIGVGTEGYAPTPVNTPMGVVMQNEKVAIDEKLLMSISAETGGSYFRAKDDESLQKIYNEIGRLERTKVEITTYHRYSEKFYPFVFIAMICLFLEVLFRYTLFRKFP